MTMTDNSFGAIDDVLKDEIRRSFEACTSQAEYNELHTQLVAYVKAQYDNAWKLLKQQIKDHFHEYDVEFYDRRIVIHANRVDYAIDSNGEWSLQEIDATECTSAADVAELASIAEDMERDIEDDDILDTIRQYFEIKPRRAE
jgi:hypothetical protein